MADNVTANAGAGGATFAADDIGGVHHQRVKIEHGADGSATDVSAASPLPTTRPAGTSALSNVASGAVSATALSATATRLGMMFCNDADKSCYLKFGTTASATSFTKKLLPGEQWEPAINYTGRVDVIWDAAPTGSLRVTELTA